MRRIIYLSLPTEDVKVKRSHRVQNYLPVEILAGSNPFHMTDFTPGGNMLMTGEKNRIEPQEPSDGQLILRVVLHRYDRRLIDHSMEPALVLPRVATTNDAIGRFSPCRKMLAACVAMTPN